MKKTNKQLKLSCSTIIILLIVGIILMGSSFLLTGGKIGAIVNSTGVHYQFDESKQIQEQRKVADFQNIQIDVTHLDINLIPADSYHIEYVLHNNDDELSVEVVDGVLQVKNLRPVSFNWAMLQVGFAESSHLNIYYPHDAKMQNVQIQTTSGSIKASKLQVKNEVTLTSGSGEIYLSDITANQVQTVSTSGKSQVLGITSEGLTVKTNSGAIKGENLAQQDAQFESKSGAINLNDIKTTMLKTKSRSGEVNVSGLVSEDLITTTTSGAVNLNGQFGESTTVETTSGAIKLESTQAKTDFTFKFKRGSGSVNGVSPEIKESSDKNLSYGTGSKNISLQSNSGSIKIVMSE